MRIGTAFQIAFMLFCYLFAFYFVFCLLNLVGFADGPESGGLLHGTILCLGAGVVYIGYFSSVWWIQDRRRLIATSIGALLPSICVWLFCLVQLILSLHL